MMNVLIIGNGGREAALAWKLAQSPAQPKLFMPTGNDGLNEIAICVELGDDVVGFCQKHEIDFVVVGGEAPLLEGLGDRLRSAGIKAFAPSAQAAQLEGSKTFTRKICDEYKIPSPKWQNFTEANPAKKYIAAQEFPLVIKADGLAAGKGVVIAENLTQAQTAIDDIFDGKFGKPSLVVEEFMTGREASFFVLSDGITAKPFSSAQDHKRAFDNDEGPNTGGMGAFSPAIIMTPEIENEVMVKIIEPTLQAMRDKGTPFIGVLYAGLMLTPQGAKLVEFNVRFGDPECQTLMMRLESDLLEILLACVEGQLASQQIKWKKTFAALIVMAAGGYPEEYQKGAEIKGLDEVSRLAQVFFAAIKLKNGLYLANGGRVLNVAALGDTLKIACDKAYQAIAKIDWRSGFYRHDIGKKYMGGENG